MELSFEILAKYEQIEAAKKRVEQFEGEYDRMLKLMRTEDVKPIVFEAIQNDIDKTRAAVKNMQVGIVDAVKSLSTTSPSEFNALSGSLAGAMNLIEKSVAQSSEQFKEFKATLSGDAEINAATSAIANLAESARSISGAIGKVKNDTTSLSEYTQKVASLDLTTQSAQINKYNGYIRGLSASIEESAARIRDWEGSQKELTSASNANEAAQQRLKQMISEQQGAVDGLKQKLTELSAAWMDARGQKRLDIGAQKSGLEAELTSQIVKLDELKVKSAELQTAFDAAKTSITQSAKEVGTALSYAEANTTGKQIREQFEGVHAKITVANDALARYNKEMDNISMQSARIESLRQAISGLDSETQGGAIAKLEAEMRKCSSSIDDSIAKVAKWQAQTSTVNAANQAASSAVSSLTESINTQQNVVDELGKRLEVLKTMYQSATGSQKEMISADIQSVQNSLVGEEQTLQTMKATLQGVQAEWNALGERSKASTEGMASSTQRATEAQKQLQEQTGRSTEEQKRLSTEAKNQQQAVSGLIGTWKEFLGTIGVAAGAKAFITQLIQVNAKMEQVKTSLYGIMKSKSEADALFQSISNVSSHSAIGLGSLAGVAQQFVAFGESADRIPKLLEAINQVSMGSEQRFNQLASALEMMSAMGQVNTRTIRSMIRAGYNPLIAISKETGESIKELNKKVKDGTIPVSQITNSFIAATKEGGMFYKMNDKMANTLSYQFAVMKKNVAAFFLELGKGNDGTLKSVTTMFVNLTKHLKEFAEAAKLVVTFAGMKAGVALVTNAVLGLSAAFKAASASVIGLGTAMSTAEKMSGWGTIISLVATLGVAIYDFATNTKTASDALSDFNKAVGGSTSDVEKLFAVLRSTDSASKTHQDALKELVAKYGEYGISIDTSKGLLNDEVNITQQLIEKKDTLIGLIRTEAAERAKAAQIKKYEDRKDEIIEDETPVLVRALKGKVRNVGVDAGKEITEGMAEGLSIAIIDEVNKAMPRIAKASYTYETDTAKRRAIWNNNKAELQSIGATFESNKNGDYIKYAGQIFQLTEQNVEQVKMLNKVIKMTGLSANSLGAEYTYTMDALFRELGRITNKQTDFCNATKESSSELDINALRARYSQMSVEQLGNSIRNLVENYRDNTISFHINVDDINVPKWMKGLGLDLEGLKNNAAFHKAFADRIAASGKGYGYRKKSDGTLEKVTLEQEATAAAQYQKAAEERQAADEKAEAEKEKKEKEEAKEQKKKDAAERKRQAALAKENRKKEAIKEASRNYTDTLNSATESLSSDIESQENALEDNSVERKLAEAEIAYSKAVQSAEDKIESVAKSLYKLNKAKGDTSKSVQEIKTEILKADETNREFGALLTAYNQAISVAGKQLVKSQQDVIDELESTYNKAEKDRADKLKKLNDDIVSLQKLADEAEKKGDEATAGAYQKLISKATSNRSWVADMGEEWSNYYEKYGTHVEKQRALLDNFNRNTDGLDKSSPEYLALKAEYDKAYSALEAEGQLAHFDWMSAFSDLAKLSNGTLESVKNQLKEILETDNKLNATDRAKFAEKYNQVDEQLKKNKTQWIGDSGIPSLVANRKIDKKQRQDALDEAQRKYDEAAKRKSEADKNKLQADENLEDRRESLNDFLSNNGSKLRTEDLNGLDANAAFEMVRQSGGDFTQLSAQFKNLFSGFKGAQQGAQAAASQAGQAAQAMADAESGLSAAQGAMGGAGGAALTETIIKGVNQNIQSLNQLAQKFGDEDSGFVRGMAQFAESSDEAVAAFDSLKSGDVFGVILHLSNAFESLGKSVATWFGYDDGKVAYKKELEHYEKLKDIWDDLIDKKKEYISLAYGNDAVKAIKEVEQLYTAEATSVKRTAEKFLAQRSLGAHSYGYREDKSVGTEGFKAWSQIAGQNITSVRDLLSDSLDYDTLLAIKSANNGEYWARMSSEMREYLDQLISIKKSTEELGDTMSEKFMGLTFDDMKSNFASALKDMDKNASDFCTDFKSYLRDAVIDSEITKKYTDRLQTIYDKYDSLGTKQGGKLTQEQRLALQKEVEDLANEAVAERNQKVNDWGLSESQAEESQKSSYATASEDSIDELSGRMLALNEAAYSILGVVTESKANADAMNSAISTTLQTIHSSVLAALDLQSNSYLELVSIRDNTASTNTFLQSMANEVVKIRKKIDNV